MADAAARQLQYEYKAVSALSDLYHYFNFFIENITSNKTNVINRKT